MNKYSYYTYEEETEYEQEENLDMNNLEQQNQEEKLQMFSQQFKKDTTTQDTLPKSQQSIRIEDNIEATQIQQNPDTQRSNRRINSQYRIQKELQDIMQDNDEIENVKVVQRTYGKSNQIDTQQFYYNDNEQQESLDQQSKSDINQKLDLDLNNLIDSYMQTQSYHKQNDNQIPVKLSQEIMAEDIENYEWK